MIWSLGTLWTMYVFPVTESDMEMGGGLSANILSIYRNTMFMYVLYLFIKESKQKSNNEKKEKIKK